MFETLVENMSETAVRNRWGGPGEVMNNLSGRWSLDRAIAGIGGMRGVATFTPLDQNSLAYREQGSLKLLDGTELQAEREYIYRARRDGFDVLFKENPVRLFHQVSLRQGEASEYRGSADHLCGGDEYRSTYTFLPNGGFTIRHVVRGLRKDYTIVTAYSRAAATACYNSPR